MVSDFRGRYGDLPRQRRSIDMAVSTDQVPQVHMWERTIFLS